MLKIFSTLVACCNLRMVKDSASWFFTVTCVNFLLEDDIGLLPIHMAEPASEVVLKRPFYENEGSWVFTYI